MVASRVASFEVSVSFGWMRANSTDASLDGMGVRKSPKGLKATVVPMYSGRGRIKDRVGLVYDAIKTRDRDLRPGGGVLDLAVAEARVITPRSVE